MSGRPLIVGNWKMNLDEGSAGTLAETVAAGLGAVPHSDVGVAPPFPFLRAVLDRAAGSRLAVGAQDLHWEDRGAFTGAVAPSMIAGMGATFVIVGHSERRRIFGDTDADVARKTAAAVRHGLAPIVCIGETEEERMAGRALEVVAHQMREALASVDGVGAETLTVAYEPVWAIGTGRVPTTEQVVEVHSFVRGRLLKTYGAETGPRIRILYGGSVTAENARDLLSLNDVNGALVGGASLDAAQFMKIAAAAGPR